MKYLKLITKSIVILFTTFGVVFVFTIVCPTKDQMEVGIKLQMSLFATALNNNYHDNGVYPDELRELENKSGKQYLIKIPSCHTGSEWEYRLLSESKQSVVLSCYADGFYYATFVSPTTSGS